MLPSIFAACDFPAISLREGDAYRLVLAFDEAGIPLSDAAALLDDIAARIDDPVRQLL